MARHPGRYYKNISLLVKLAIVVLAFGFIYKQVFYRPDSEELLEQLRDILLDPPYFLLAISVLLMFLNWGTEAWKWKLLVSKSESISFGLAARAVLSGITIGAFTPNRFGEFAGRIFYLRDTDRVDGIMMTFAGSAAQLLVTVSAGCIAFIVLPLTTSIEVFIDKTAFYIVAGVFALITTAALFAYFSVSSLAVRMSRVSFLKKHKAHILLLSRYSMAELLNVFLLSLIRYCVFSFQFLLMLEVFRVDISWGNAFVAICLNYLIVAVVPTVALVELGIRGSAALATIGFYSDDPLGIIAASFALWIINIALPALAGAVFVFGLKFFNGRS